MYNRVKWAQYELELLLSQISPRFQYSAMLLASYIEQNNRWGVTRLPQGLRPEDPIVALGGRIPNEGVCMLVRGV